MDKNQLLEALKMGNYEIKLDCNCGCDISWHIDNGMLNLDVSGDDCWIANILCINDVIIAEFPAHGYFESVDAGMSTDELNKMLEDNGIEHIISDMCPSGCLENLEHIDRVTKELISFIKDNGYYCYIRYPRDFANEYVCILAEKDINVEDAEEIDADEFTFRYLRQDDGTTKYYIGFSYID